MSITPGSGFSSPDDHAMGPHAPQPWTGQYAGPSAGYGVSDPYASPSPGGSPAMGQPVPYGAAPGYGPVGQPMAVVAAKTPAVAVLLSILWLGAGHLYAGRTALGLALMAVDVFLVLFLMVPLIGWVLAPLAWFGLCIYAAISSSNAVKRRNAQWGLPQY